jgi:hypothetical protein
VGDPDESGESDLKARDFSAQDLGAPFENPSDGGIDCGTRDSPSNGAGDNQATGAVHRQADSPAPTGRRIQPMIVGQEIAEVDTLAEEPLMHRRGAPDCQAI